MSMLKLRILHAVLVSLFANYLVKLNNQRENRVASFAIVSIVVAGEISFVHGSLNKGQVSFHLRL